MSKIVDLINSIPNAYTIEGCSEEQISEAEKELGLKFPQEFIDYVKEFGCVDFSAHEFTGLNIEGRLNTVTATKKEISVNPSFPKDCFVFEDLGIEAVLIIVNESGEVFRIQYENIEKISDSIFDYISSIS
ncbi:SMI1/KNR4 family protein [Butyrivibrio sp. AE2032]|uniref:SMI1/KNR4 family protein n=1 Tax=Butyrivibrio sp. AE2032 TaxID=1458463 RepID=UPI00068D0C88|nr:SMI1/KNR4 family protein [Butyrivibrio sp. AE2032]